MKVEGLRKTRMEDLVQREIAFLLIDGVKEPKLQGELITVTRVEMTVDFKLARVYVSILKEADREKILDGLKKATGFLKSQVSRNLKMRYTPDLEFKIDDSLDHVQRIEQLLNQSKKS